MTLIISSATKPEIDCILRNLDKIKRVAGMGCPAWQGTYAHNDVIAIQTGIGRARVENILVPILKSLETTAVISLGFAGALTRDLSVGDITICTTVVAEGENNNVYHTDKDMVSYATAAMKKNKQKMMTGKSVTIPYVAYSHEAKQKLKDAHQAEICEMEDYWIARAANGRQIPFLAVRVISDGLDAVMPEFDGMVDRQGYVKLGATAVYLMSHPRHIMNMWKIYENFRCAQESLTAFTASFLDKYFNQAGDK